MARKVLVLNADFTPIKVRSWQYAMIQILTPSKHGAYVVEYYDEWVILDSSGKKHRVPAVIALKKYVDIGGGQAAFTKTNVHYRDQMTCQYCGKKHERRSDLTIDHVIPSSRWKVLGKTGRASSFENTVSCCQECNKKKADKTCQEVGMFPRNKPKPISMRQAFANRLIHMENHIPNEWLPYLQGITT